MNILKDIDPKVRFLVLHLEAQLPSKQISNILGISYSTIRDWTRKTDQGEDIRIIHPGRGPKPVISEEIKRKVARDVLRIPKNIRQDP